MTDSHPDNKQGRWRKPAFRAAAAALSLCAFALSGCGAGGDAFGGYDLPESEEVASADWPRLADAPQAVAEGVYTDAAPNPVTGLVVVETLTAEAQSSAARAAWVGEPVLSDADKRRLRRAGP